MGENNYRRFLPDLIKEQYRYLEKNDLEVGAGVICANTTFLKRTASPEGIPDLRPFYGGLTYHIESIDHDRGSVTFRMPSGELLDVTIPVLLGVVPSPDGYAYVVPVQ